jgi:hypothetical protein
MCLLLLREREDLKLGQWGPVTRCPREQQSPAQARPLWAGKGIPPLAELAAQLETQIAVPQVQVLPLIVVDGARFRSHLTAREGQPLAAAKAAATGIEHPQARAIRVARVQTGAAPRVHSSA